MPSSSEAPTSSVKGVPALLLDRNVRFDVPHSELLEQTGRGERILMKLSPVEDTKGNTGKRGVLYVSNLRFMWHSAHRTRNNLSVGYYGVCAMDVQMMNTRLCGNVEALRVTAKFGSSRFEFLFTHPSENKKLLGNVRSVWRAYDSTRIYRELRLRSCAVREGELALLPGEQLVTGVKDVCHVCQGDYHAGTFFTTNLRLLWCSKASLEFNMSVPFLQIAAIHIQNTIYGRSLVLDTSISSGSHVLTFRIDPEERLQQLFKECATLLRAFKTHPNLGVAIALQDSPSKGANESGSSTPVAECVVAPVPQVIDGENVVQEVASDAFAAYYVGVGQKGTDRDPEYNASIGLAVEKLRSGVTLQELWTVIT
uniref:BBSome complex member BBS5 PH domain-containing protein n=1 Tax=Trypanosoma congolense (strain IL3000) TaxID=1068625 RepID=G0UJ51_TRYCI|nr:conserved hypothetical protein [Trypanosoma congolense IL3000]